MVATPQRRLAWNEAKESAANCLKGNDAWDTLVQAYFENLEQNHPEATVTARFYNPCDLMMSLYRFAKFSAGDMLPTAEIVVTDKDALPFRIVLGVMVWNGKRVTNVAEVLPEDISSLFDLYLAGALNGGQWAFEEHLIAQHGLSYVLVECTPSREGGIVQQLIIDEGALRRRPFNEEGLKEFDAFYEAHRDYLNSLVENFDSFASFR
jgi:hypothetical protein